MTPDAWIALRQKTSARIALGRCGGSLPTEEWLKFGMAHAQARDAVHVGLDVLQLQRDLLDAGLNDELVVTVSSQVGSRDEYLRRPDLGRKLCADSVAQLNAMNCSACDLAVIIGDGLSALATQRHAAPLLVQLLPKLRTSRWTMAPLVIAKGARVALMDEIGSLLNAELCLILLGERPGLTACDSLGAYFVYGPNTNRTDADRNCVSNIHPQGMSSTKAAETLYFLLTQARVKKLSGVTLKDTRQLELTRSGTIEPGSLGQSDGC